MLIITLDQTATPYGERTGAVLPTSDGTCGANPAVRNADAVRG